jgi:transposase
VLEVSRTPRAERRLRGKDDALDAVRAARAARASETLALPRSGERREALRLLLVARRSAVAVRRAARVQLRTARSLQPSRPLRLADRRRGRDQARPPQPRAPHRSSDGARPPSPKRELLAHVRALAPQLLDEPGVGPIVAAQLIISWAQRGRLRSETAFAPLAGVAPLPASSGQTVRHRLSPGGDRPLNRALHTVVLHRRQHDPTTQAYIARRLAEGKSRREAARQRKRYLTRHLYRVLDNQVPHMT